jgi:hypothetical protein
MSLATLRRLPNVPAISLTLAHIKRLHARTVDAQNNRVGDL